MKARDVGMLFALASIWGASFLFIRMAVHDYGAPLLVLVRVLLGGLILLGVARLTRQPTQLRAHWGKFLLLGAVNSALPFTMIASAEIHLTASFAAILNATTPFFAALMSWLVLKDALTPRKIVGLLVGLVGVAMVVGWSPLELTPEVLLAIGMMFVGSCAYGVGTVYSKKSFAGVSPFTMAIGQQLGSSVLMLPLALATLPTEVPSTSATLAVLALAVLCTAVAYVLFFTLVSRVGPTNTSTVTMLVPFFGILWGALFLGEAVEIGQLFGFALILVALTQVTGFKLGWRKEPSPAIATK
jgi:drug/metabolite transporter (DMT)-like permease